MVVPAEWTLSVLQNRFRGQTLPERIACKGMAVRPSPNLGLIKRPPADLSSHHGQLDMTDDREIHWGKSLLL